MHRPPRYDPEELLGIVPMDYRRPVDMRQVIARIVDDRVVLDLRSVLPEQDAQLAAAVEGALARSR